MAFFGRAIGFRRGAVISFLGFLLAVVSRPVDDQQAVEDTFMGCAFPDVNATTVNLTSCLLNDIPNELKNFDNLTHLDLSRNYLTNIDPDFFLQFNKLVDVDLSYNCNFSHLRGTGCVIKSKTIKKIDASHCGFGVIHPSQLCTPNLKYLVLVGNPGCEETRALFKSMGLVTKFFCGGRVPDPACPVSNDSMTTQSPLHPEPFTTDKPAVNVSNQSRFTTEESSTLPISPPHAIFPTPNENNTTVDNKPKEPAGQSPTKYIVRLVAVVFLVVILFFTYIFWDNIALMFKYFRGRCVHYVRDIRSRFSQNTRPAVMYDETSQNPSDARDDSTNSHTSPFLQK